MKAFRVLFKLALIIVSLPVMLIMLVGYLICSAERDANTFCDQIAPGADIIHIIQQFEKQTGIEKESGDKVSARHYGFPDEGYGDHSHTFLFPAMMFDRAYCRVSLRENGKVKSKTAYFQAD